MKLVSLISFLISSLSAHYCLFTPPKEFKMADPKKTPAGVEIAYVGKSKNSFTPSLNLIVEKSSLSLSAYLEEAKKSFRKDEAHLSDLGPFPLKNYSGRLLQIDLLNTAWGTIRQMQVILSHKEQMFVLTAAAEKEDFMALQSSFFKTFHSMDVVEDVLSEFSPERRKNLEQAVQRLSKKKLGKYLEKNFSDMNPYALLLALKELKINK